MSSSLSHTDKIDMWREEKYSKWREENPGRKIDYEVLCTILGVESLSNSDLNCADLCLTDLRYADLRHTDLRYADLVAADLSYADLRYANLCDADFQYADLRFNLLRLFYIDGIHRQPAYFWLTPEGWQTRIGCWSGTTESLRELIAQDGLWPEATDWSDATEEQIERHRPLLERFADMCDAYKATFNDELTSLAEYWKERDSADRHHQGKVTP